MSTAVLSVRVRRELKEEAERLGIDLRTVVERALEEEIKRARRSKFKELLEGALAAMDVPAEDWIRDVEESRAGR